MLQNSFDPADAEARISAEWAKNDWAVFKPSGAGEPFTIVIPPPNVTGSLHMGHALNNTLQDALARFWRMRGRSVLWQPGMDHAGIATQMVVERQLADRQQKRTDFTREDFVAKVWEWKAESGGTIIGQLKRLGASCDWSRERFTMDEGLSAAVRKVFVQLYNEALIYRDKRLVNWDPKFETAISDLEVENIEVDGHFWHFKYPLENGETYQFPIAFDEDGHAVEWETRDYISIATTRPETMLGDGAVAVHPSDKRYAPIVGKRCHIPVGDDNGGKGRLIPIITDDYPDPDFGSGAVKITGAHDFNDYKVAKKHGLPMLILMDEKARMLSGVEYIPQDYWGLDRYVARDKVIAEIDAKGLMIRVEDKNIMQPFGDRSGVVIEPMLTDQWYVDAENLAERAIEAVEKGETRFVPENWTKTYFQWMRNIEPWCVSRQLWWGHQIPAWYGPNFPQGGISDKSEPDGKNRLRFVGVDFDDVRHQATQYYGTPNIEENIEGKGNELDQVETSDPAHRSIRFGWNTERQDGNKFKVTRIGLVRDPDVLDTWFSSALWPFSTLGWPEDDKSLHPEEGQRPVTKGPVTKGEGTGADALRDASLRRAPQGKEADVKRAANSLAPDPSPAGGTGERAPSLLHTHYPTSVLVTAHDIIFFWVARMMMMGLHFMKEVPFHDVYIHALVLDEKGQKMSKSKGNVIDPLTLIEKYGADALRFTLAAQAAQGRNIRLSEARVEGYRNFTTKLWNAARFGEMNGTGYADDFNPSSAQETLNRWIAHEANLCVAEVTAAMESYRFNDAAGAVYKFAWNVYCDWFVELSKPIVMGPVGPAKEETRAMAAWVYDVILRLLHPFMPFVTEELWGSLRARANMLIIEQWPEVDPTLEAPAAAADINWMIGLITEVRSLRAEMNVPAGAKIPLVAIGIEGEAASRLSKSEPLVMRLARIDRIERVNAPPKGAVQFVHAGSSFALPLAGFIDFAAERVRLSREIEKAEKEIAGLDARLGNPSFIERAPAEVVDENRARRADLRARADKLKAAAASLLEA